MSLDQNDVCDEDSNHWETEHPLLQTWYQGQRDELNGLLEYRVQLEHQITDTLQPPLTEEEILQALHIVWNDFEAYCTEHKYNPLAQEYNAYHWSVRRQHLLQHSIVRQWYNQYRHAVLKTQLKTLDHQIKALLPPYIL